MNRLGKSTAILMLFTIISKILGFIRELTLTSIYGAGTVADAYIISSSIPTLLFATIGTALATTFIPLFYEVEETRGKEASLKFANNIFNIVIIICGVLSLIGFIFAEPLVKVFAIDFNGEKLKLSVEFTRIVIFGLIFIALSNIMTSWLQIKNKFSIPGIIGLPYNIIIILGIHLSSMYDLRIIAWATLLAIFSQVLFQLPFAIKNGYKYETHINLKDEYIKKIGILIVPVFIGVGVNQINTIVDKSLASTLGDGVITILNSANRLNEFVVAIFIMTISSVIYPTLSKLSNESNKKDFIESVSKSINIVLILVIPISVGSIILSEPIVRVIFERGAFDPQSTHRTAIALSCYSLGMTAYGIREILNKVFYSLKDTKTPMINGALAMIINIILNILSINYLGYIGLALSTSVSALICIMILFRKLKNKLGYFGQDKIFSTLVKTSISALIMSIVTLISYNLLFERLSYIFMNDVLVLGISIIMGASVYFILIVLLGVEEISSVILKMKKVLKFI